MNAMASRPIVLVGMMGAGKTSVGRVLASRLGGQFLDLDEVVERRAGRRVAEIFVEQGEVAFRALESAALADLLRDDDDLLEELAAALDPTDAKALAVAPLPLARRAVRRWLADPLPPDLATVDRVLAVARGEVPGCDVGRGRQIRRSKQRLFLSEVR